MGDIDAEKASTQTQLAQQKQALEDEFKEVLCPKP